MARSQKIPALSIIIPTLNEADHLPLLLADLNEWPYNFELIIVDGGSIDLTISIAQIQGIDVIKSSIGFARCTGDGIIDATIWDVAINPVYQGYGLGKQLMEYLMKDINIFRL